LTYTLWTTIGISCLLPFILRNYHVGFSYVVAVGFVSYAWGKNLFITALLGLGFLTYSLVVRFVKLPGDLWPLDKWHAKGITEEPLDPEQPIIDPHHHLWDPKVHDKGWQLRKILLKFRSWLRPTFAVDLLNKDIAKKKDGFLETFSDFGLFLQPYMAPEFLEDIKNNNVRATVYLECGWNCPIAKSKCMAPVPEADMVAEIASNHPNICQGMVAHADLRLGKLVEPALKAYASKPWVKGIRHALAFSPDQVPHSWANSAKGIALTQTFQEGIALLEKYGFSFDTWLYHFNLDDLCVIAKKFPNLSIITDHVALPVGIGRFDRDTTFLEWAAGIRKLSKYPNVLIKLSGLGMCVFGFNLHNRDMPPSSSELAELWRPYIEHCIDCFGVDRCMFASNFPVDKVSCGYTQMWNAYKRIVSGRSERDKQQLFYETAKRAYRL